MFVGHALLAFAVVASLAARLGWDRERALAVGLLAAGFATVPDVDVVHPVVSLLLDPVSLGVAPDAFWALSTELHRTATHSLVVGTVAALGATAVVAGLTRRRNPGDGWYWLTGVAVGLIAFVGLAALVWHVDGAAAGGVVATMGVAAVALAVAASRYGLAPRTAGLAALFGLLSHPFGDLLTGQAPPLLYPLPVDLGLTRLTLHPDPTVHLLGAFFVELATVWLALVVLARLYDVGLGEHVSWRAGAGVAYAGAAIVLPPPSLDAATGFVFSVLAVGLVAVPVRRWRPRLVWRRATTALAAVTLAALAYGIAYLAL